MRPVVLDIMVLASGFTSRAGTSGWLLVVSEHLLTELDRTLREDRYFRARLNPAQVDGFLALLRAEATLTELTVPVESVATQPKDDLVLSSALSGGASHLVTRDRKRLRLDGYQGLAIVSPGELRTLLSEEST